MDCKMLLGALAGEEFGEQVAAAGAASVEVRGLSADSRKVEPGTVFFALSGSKADGAAYVAQAVEKGAVAIVALCAPRVPAGADAHAVVGRRGGGCA